MNRRVISAVLAASFAIAAAGAPALAEAENNGHNCIGANASSFKDSMGSFASGTHGGIVEFYRSLRASAFCSVD